VSRFYSFALATTWSRVIAGTSVGAMLGYHETRLDVSAPIAGR